MVGQDFGYRINELSRRMSDVERIIKKLMGKPDISGEDWDNATLIREWGICKRTAANYRLKGLGFLKRGGRIVYTPEHRADFLKLQQRDAVKTDNNTD